MKIFKKFEENLEYLGFDMAPVAWDLAHFKFQSEDDRISFLESITARRDNNPNGSMGGFGSGIQQPTEPTRPTFI